VVELLPSGQGVNYGAAVPFALFVHVFCLRLASGIIQSGGVEVKRPVTLVTPAILLAESILLDLNDLDVSTDTGTANNEVNSSMSKPIKKRDFRIEIRAEIRGTRRQYKRGTSIRGGSMKETWLGQ
jgi:hypothetical protein